MGGLIKEGAYSQNQMTRIDSFSFLLPRICKLAPSLPPLGLLAPLSQLTANRDGPNKIKYIIFHSFVPQEIVISGI